MWTIFKVFIEFVTILFLLYILVLGLQACGILAPQAETGRRILNHWVARLVHSRV